MKHYFTSESVTPGHPDKICDQIGDAILDEALRQDPTSKMAVEATIKDNFIFVYGEVSTNAIIDYAVIAKDVLKKIGYTEEFEVLVKVAQQSSEINQAVTSKFELGAGDQGIMFGYACSETNTHLPLSISLAHKLAKQLHEVFLAQESPILKPDGKTQVTVEYDGQIIKRIDAIVVSAQHYPNITQDFLYDFIRKEVIEIVIDPTLVDDQTKYIINPSGSFVVGGPFGDSGTTGRKIVVDTYGGHGRIGGGCLSSKDPTKVDRSAAYYCRYVAKNIVANGLAKRFEIQVSYAIGMPDPISIYINSFGTNTICETEILKIINNNFNFSVSNMIAELELTKPIYQETANFGHFGREDIIFPWENIKNLQV